MAIAGDLPLATARIYPVAIGLGGTSSRAIVQTLPLETAKIYPVETGIQTTAPLGIDLPLPPLAPYRINGAKDDNAGTQNAGSRCAPKPPPQNPHAAETLAPSPPWKPPRTTPPETQIPTEIQTGTF